MMASVSGVQGRQDRLVRCNVSFPLSLVNEARVKAQGGMEYRADVFISLFQRTLRLPQINTTMTDVSSVDSFTTL